MKRQITRKEFNEKKERIAAQLGTLGGGNHFIEIGYDEDNVVWVVIHSGSRNIGHATATEHMKLASGTDKAVERNFGFDVNSINGMNYIADLNFCLEFALQNRLTMMKRVENILTRRCGGVFVWDRLINRNHNHAELKDEVWIHRKGATQAESGMGGVIPGNMKDGSFIVEGLGNVDSLYSSSHGAGRVMGRKVAQKSLSMEKFTESMQGITALVTKDTLDESCMAYKDIYEVMRLQDKLVKVIAHVKPVINIKAVGEC